MKLNERQKHILIFLKDGPQKKSDIVQKFKHWYYQGNTEIASRYIGEILYRLCKRNILIKPKHGFYELNKDLKKSSKKCDGIDNQLNLF